MVRSVITTLNSSSKYGAITTLGASNWCQTCNNNMTQKKKKAAAAIRNRLIGFLFVFIALKRRQIVNVKIIIFLRVMGKQTSWKQPHAVDGIHIMCGHRVQNGRKNYFTLFARQVTNISLRFFDVSDENLLRVWNVISTKHYIRKNK